MTTRCEHAVYWGELALILKYIYMSHIYMEVFNCGLALIDCICIFICIYRTYLLSGSFNMEVYIWVYICGNI